MKKGTQKVKITEFQQKVIATEIMDFMVLAHKHI